MPTIELDKKLTRYLLGDLSEQERIEIEDRYLSNKEFFDELVVAEDELIDDCVRGKLSGKDRELFEQNFLTSTARRERVKSSRALMEFADTHEHVNAEQDIGHKHDQLHDQPFAHALRTVVLPFTGQKNDARDQRR